MTRAPLNSAFGAVALGQRPFTSVGFFDPHQIAPISFQYNLNVQREVAKHTVLDVAYLATFGAELAVVSMLPLYFLETFKGEQEKRDGGRPGGMRSGEHQRRSVNREPGVQVRPAPLPLLILIA